MTKFLLIAFCVFSSANAFAARGRFEAHITNVYQRVSETEATQVSSFLTGSIRLSANGQSASAPFNVQRPATGRISQLTSSSLHLSNPEGNINAVLPIRTRGNRFVIRAEIQQSLMPQQFADLYAQVARDGVRLNLDIDDTVCTVDQYNITCETDISARIRN